MKRLKKQRFTLIILLSASMLLHLVYGLEGQAQMSELQHKIDQQEAKLRNKNIQIEMQDMILEVQDELIKESLKQEQIEHKETYVGEFTITYYCPCVKCCGKTDGITASGTLAKEGQTVAADWDILPPGTKIFIEGIGFRTVEDKGGGVKGNKLDVFMNSHSAALDAGVGQAKVYVVEEVKIEGKTNYRHED